MGQLEGNRAAIFDNRIWERLRHHPKNPGGAAEMGTPPRQTSPKVRKKTQAIGSPLGEQDHVLTSPPDRILQNEPTEPAPIQQKFSTEPTALAVRNQDARG